MTAGFYGKLPARGDFVRVGLPRGFTDPWDAWLAGALAGSRTLLGDDWLPAFLEAPVWRFILPPGLCSDRAALGLMLPSVDRAGRYFPLAFAALFAATPGADTAWLDHCEAAGRAALEQDADPTQVAAMVPVPDVLPVAAPIEPGQSLWWTDGAPRVPAARFSLPGLPDAAVYARMLDVAVAETARHAMIQVGTEQAGTKEATTMAATTMAPTGMASQMAPQGVPQGEEAWETPG